MRAPPPPESEPPDRPRWRALALLRVANHALLRRRLGRARAGEWTGELAARIGRALSGAQVAVAAADLLELAFERDARDGVAAELGALAERLGGPIEIDGEPHEVELLIGASFSDGAPADEIRLLEQAEHALRLAGTDRPVMIRDVDAAADEVDRIALAHDLSRAPARGELFLQYQPKVHLRRQQVAGVEALVRWRHPRRGLVMPGDFIPLAEETGSITALTLWTIEQAIADQAALVARGHAMRVFVNISGVLLGDPGFVERATALLGEAGDRLGFEVTETAVMRDPEAAIAHLRAFADLGVQVAIDDYGSGLSSLAYLKRLPASELKIDRLFVTQLMSTNRDPLIVRSTIDLAHALDMAVVAEGVEEQAALALLSVMGCDMAQGYLISRPVDFTALVAFLDEGRSERTIEESRARFTKLAATWKRA